MRPCSSCGADQPVGAKFCNECGASLATGCSACGSPVPPGAKFCNECGADLRVEPPAAREQVAAVVASRRITSVLFGDLVGFTPLSESRDQEDVRELLSRYFEECSRIVVRYGGVVEKFIGDAVMAVWGVPTTHEDDAERSVRAGLELVAAAGALGSEVGVPGLAMRVGIVTGEVAVTVGAQLQGMVAGDAVNTAARVQAVAAPGQVWVDETTRLLTSAAISYADVGSHALKGKADPVPLWTARAVVAHAGGAQRADGLEAPLAGRDRELRMVKEAYHRVEESGRPSLLVVAGDAGIGKTRLGWEFSKYTDGLAGACWWHAGKCVSYGEGVAFYALAEAVRSRLETVLSGEEETADTSALIERGLEQYVPEPDDREWLGPRLGALLGMTGAAGFRREDLFAAWTTFFDRLSGGDPVVMLIDDAQYADEGLVLFLEHLLAAASFPCFVLLLARPELVSEHAELVTNRRATVLHLDPLGRDDMGHLVDGLVERLPERVRTELVERAEGVPTYAVETVRALIDRDLVVPRGGTYVLADPESLDLTAIGAPASLQALVSARLDRLSPAERRVVDQASVAGASVEPAVLAELCTDVADLDRVLADLVRAQIFTVDHHRLSSEQGRYQFAQSAVRQVAYATLSRRDRKQAHLRVLEALVRDAADGADEIASVAAQHCIAAIEAAPEDPDVPEIKARAVTFLRSAADRARGLGAPKEAVGHLARALDLEPDERAACEIRLAMAEACNDAGRYEEGAQLSGSARAAFAAAGDEDGEALAAAVQCDAMLRGSEDYEGAMALVQPHLRRLRATPGKEPILARVIAAANLALSRLGRLDYEALVEQTKIADRLGDRPQVARAVSNLGVMMMTDRAEELGVTLVEKGTAVARECHDLAQLAHGLSNLASVIAPRDVARAKALIDEAVDAARRTGIVQSTSTALANQVIGRWPAGDWDLVVGLTGSELVKAEDQSILAAVGALVRQARGSDPADAVGAVEQWDVTRFYRDLGVAVGQWFADDPGAVDTARSALEGAYDMCGVYDDFTLIYGGVLDVAVAFAEPSLLDRLRAVVDDDRSPSAPQGLMGHRALLGALDGSRVGDSDDDVEGLFVQATQRYQAWGSPVYAARARAAYGVWLEQHGRAAEAEPLLAQARAAYTELGAAGWTEQLERALAGRRVASGVGSWDPETVRSVTDPHGAGGG